MRAAMGSSGTVLFYAADKVSDTGPRLCLADWGESALKLVLPTTLDYTFRNALEQFFAVQGPGGFFGNSYSTFSKGVALSRAQMAKGHAGYHGGALINASHLSFAYDCALTEMPNWPTFRGKGKKSTSSMVTLAHPGFRELRAIEPQRCRFTATTTKR